MAKQDDDSDRGANEPPDDTEHGTSAQGPSTIAGLRVLREIDRGGMGIVYEALDEALGRKVALKVISPGLANDPVFRTRFIAESKAVASLDNPHILPIYRAGEENGRLFIVTKLIAGGNLGEALEAKGRFTPEETARVITQLGEALEEAHGKGLIHRDIKPANVLVDRSGTKPNYLLTDFGLTRKASEETGITKTGEVLGTVGYMAPEQIEGQTVDRRADVYALGCLAAELLSGEPPFAKETKRATLLAHLYDEPTLPADIKVPDEEGANQVLLRAMAKDPGNRYRSSADFAHDLESRLVAHRIPGPTSTTGLSTSGELSRPRWKRVRWLFVALLAGGLLFLGAVVGYIGPAYYEYWQFEREREQTEKEQIGVAKRHLRSLTGIGNSQVFRGSQVCGPFSSEAIAAIQREAGPSDWLSFCESKVNLELDSNLLKSSYLASSSTLPWDLTRSMERRLSSTSDWWTSPLRPDKDEIKTRLGTEKTLRQRVEVFAGGSVSVRYVLVKEGGEWKVRKVTFPGFDRAGLIIPDDWDVLKR